MLSRLAASSRQIAGPSMGWPRLTSQPPFPWLVPAPLLPAGSSLYLDPSPMISWYPPHPSRLIFYKMPSWTILHSMSCFLMTLVSSCIIVTCVLVWAPTSTPPYGTPRMETRSLSFMHWKHWGQELVCHRPSVTANAHLGQSFCDPLEVVSWALESASSG